jgi:pimeloyl-ACP methyl ester carboxylesterase
MRSLRKSAAAALAGAVLGGIVLATPASAAGGPAVPTIDWQGCGAEHPGFECATVDVPLDYDDPRGPKIQLALNRKPATDKANRIGSLFVNPGGPGGSGVDHVYGRGEQYSAGLKGRFDIIGFDPRGIARSTPMRCFRTEAAAKDFFRTGGPDNTPYDEADQRPYFGHFRKLGPQCVGNAGPIAKHMSTADVVRDIDLLRRAVGDKKLSYLGFSYGTYIGSTYASMFPGNIRALAIDGVLNPALWATGWHITDDRTNSGKSFDEMLKVCDAAGPSCPFHSPAQSAKDRWEQLAASVRTKPVTVDGELVDYKALIARANSTLYSPARWREAAAFFALVAEAAPAAALKSTQQEPYLNQYEAYYGNLCADAEFPRSFPEFQAVGRYAEAGSRLGPYWWWDNTACTDWPANEDRFIGPWKTKTSAPVLVIGNYFDGVTGYEGAKAATRNIQGSRLLSYAGWGHTAYSRNTCSAGYINDYLLTGALPAEGTVCPANPNPFLDSTLSTKSDLTDLPIGPR